MDLERKLLHKVIKTSIMALFKHKLPYSPSQTVKNIDDVPEIDLGEPPSPIEPNSPVFNGEQWVFHTTSPGSQTDFDVAKISPPQFASSPKINQNEANESQKTIVYSPYQVCEQIDEENNNVTPSNIDQLDPISGDKSLDHTVNFEHSVQIISETDVDEGDKSVHNFDRILDQGDKSVDNVDRILDEFKQKAAARKRLLPSQVSSKYTFNSNST